MSKKIDISFGGEPIFIEVPDYISIDKMEKYKDRHYVCRVNGKKRAVLEWTDGYSYNPRNTIKNWVESIKWKQKECEEE